MNQSRDPFSETLRRLNTVAPDGAPSALGGQLKDEFRRHHARLRKNRHVQISLLAACLIGAATLTVIVLRPHTARNIVVVMGSEAPEVVAVHEAISAGADQPVHHQLTTRARKSRAPVNVRKNSSSEDDRFVALPTFDPAIPIDHLDMVRLDLPGRALRLVGYPVSEEMAERRVLADVLLAQDGTPYALRLVQTSESEGHE